MNNEIPLLFANCLLVKGASQCIICDLQRNSYVSIPNGLYEILTEHKGKSVSNIKAIYNNDYDDIIDEYFQILILNELLFLTDTPDLFPELEMSWDEPFEVSNAIIDIGEHSDYDFDKVLSNLHEINCKFLQIRIYKKFSFIEMEGLLQKLESIGNNPLGVEFCLNDHTSFTPEKTRGLFQRFSKLNLIAFYTSPLDGQVDVVEEGCRYIIHSKSPLSSEKSCGITKKDSFTINIKMFAESGRYNSCLNRKVSIDANGNIKNCPSMPQSFGNIKDSTLQDALGHKDFKKYWSLTKDQVEVCKDCEFRYICTDCRAYKEDPSNDYSKPLKCGYSPYTNTWQEWSANPLKQGAIEHYGMQELVKKNG